MEQPSKASFLIHVICFLGDLQIWFLSYQEFLFFSRPTILWLFNGENTSLNKPFSLVKPIFKRQQKEVIKSLAYMKVIEIEILRRVNLWDMWRRHYYTWKNCSIIGGGGFHMQNNLLNCNEL